MNLSQSLKYIVHNLHINSEKFSVICSDFTLETDSVKIVQLQNLSPEIQYHYLFSQFSDLLHSIYFDGSFVLEENQVIKTNYQILEEAFSLEIDWEFYKKLDENNKGKGWFHPDFLVLKQESGGSVAAEFDRMILHFQPERHLPLAQQSVKINELVDCWLPSSFIDKYRYVANGDIIGDFPSAKISQPQLFIYFNFTPESAISIMKFVTAELNAMKVPFIFEVLHNPLNYKRYTSGILRFIRYDYKQMVLPVLQKIFTSHRAGFKSQVPLFTKMLASGIGLAEHPDRKLQFTNQERFGINRCKILANALLEAHQKGDESPESRIKYINQYFASLGINLERPYLNPGSEDIYTRLDL